MTLLERLRKVEPEGGGERTRWYRNPDGPEAADEIERLREALRKIGYGPPHEGEPLELLNQFVDLARSALQQKESE